jgi:hypothetical protein
VVYYKILSQHPSVETDANSAKSARTTAEWVKISNLRSSEFDTEMITNRSRGTGFDSWRYQIF